MIFRYKIEIISDIEQKIRKLLVNIAVAPFVGVWVEIVSTILFFVPVQSLPSWECGLKSLDDDIEAYDVEVAPFVGVWVEICVNASTSIATGSLPSWECGLK